MLIVEIDEQEPSPRTDQEAQRLPSSLQLATDQRKLLQDAQRTLYASTRVGGEAVSDDHTVEIFDRGEAQLDVCHALQLFKRDGSSLSGLLQSELRLLVGSRDAVEQGDHVAHVRVSLLERHRQQRPRQRSLLHMRALSQPGQPSGVLRVERHI